MELDQQLFLMMLQKADLVDLTSVYQSVLEAWTVFFKLKGAWYTCWNVVNGGATIHEQCLTLNTPAVR